MTLISDVRSDIIDIKFRYCRESRGETYVNQREAAVERLQLVQMSSSSRYDAEAESVAVRFGPTCEMLAGLMGRSRTCPEGHVG